MTFPDDEPWFDEHAGPLIRPYTVSNGRTRPTQELDLVSQVVATGTVPAGRLDLEYARALGLCQGPVSVAEVAAQMRLPVMVTKVLLSDLIDCGALITQAPWSVSDPHDPKLLEAVLDGLRRRL
jgi:Protein of unknown function (DUF742)